VAWLSRIAVVSAGRQSVRYSGLREKIRQKPMPTFGEDRLWMELNAEEYPRDVRNRHHDAVIAASRNA